VCFFGHVFLAVYFDFEVREYQIIWFKFKILDVTPMIPVEIMSKHHLNSLAIRQPLFALFAQLPLAKNAISEELHGRCFLLCQSGVLWAREDYCPELEDSKQYQRGGSSGC